MNIEEFIEDRLVEIETTLDYPFENTTLPDYLIFDGKALVAGVREVLAWHRNLCHPMTDPLIVAIARQWSHHRDFNEEWA